MIVYPQDDSIFLYGGFSKEKMAIVEAGKQEGRTHDDLWMIDMKPALGKDTEAGHESTKDTDITTSSSSMDNKGFQSGSSSSSSSSSSEGKFDMSKIGWTKLSKKGAYPSPRSGAAMAFFKNKGILFGGVYDNEEPRHGLKSRFLDDMFTLDLSSRRWYSLETNRSGTSGAGSSADGEGAEHGIFESFTKVGLSDDVGDDGGGDDDDNDGRVASTGKEADGDYNDLSGIDSHYVTSYFTERYKSSPCPRINPALIVKGSKLYLYGGVCELSDIEVALDDCWVLDLNKRTGWKCVTEGTMSRFVWKGAITEGTEGTLTDDDDGDGEGDDNDHNGDSDDDDDDDDEEEEEEEEIKAGKALEGKEKTGKKDPLSTVILRPRAGEDLREFYVRTAAVWTDKAEAAGDASEVEAARAGLLTEKQLSKRMKELRKTGFAMCEQHYKEHTENAA